MSQSTIELQISLTEYLTQLEQLVIARDLGSDSTPQILQCIEAELQQAQGTIFEAFFRGELSFYQEQYDVALKNYLQAKEVPDSHFFCYRASAFLSLKNHLFDKWRELAKKALRVRPYDYITLKMLESTLTEGMTPEEYIETHQKIQELVSKSSFDGKITFSDEKINPAATESSMNSKENISSGVLTQRLYDSKAATLPEAFPPYAERSESILSEVANTLQKSIVPEQEHTLETRVRAFQKYQSELISDYVEHTKKRSQLKDNFLYILNGWNHQNGIGSHNETAPTPLISRFLLTEQSRKTSGGFYLRWQGKGVVINPGTNFLDYFHQYGLHIRDIDYVIITRDAEDTYADVKAIYDLNYQLNSANSELHIIHYYLNQKAYMQIGRTLKPNFKQERNTVHCLELYLDSPDVEKIDLTDSISLNYFPTSVQEALHHQNAQTKEEQRSPRMQSSLGIRLDLTTLEKSHSPLQTKKAMSLGYFAGTPWSPLLAHHLGNCDILLAGFENTNAQDYGKIKYNDECLGYYGIFSLLEEVEPRILLCCEFGGREGDIRIEIAKKMREEYAHLVRQRELHSTPHSVVLPGDIGLYVDLKTLRIQCSVSKAFVDPSLIRVVKSSDAFGHLKYLAPNCCL